MHQEIMRATASTALGTKHIVVLLRAQHCDTSCTYDSDLLSEMMSELREDVKEELRAQDTRPSWVESPPPVC